MKKSQVTVFIILGAALIAIIALVIYMAGMKEDTPPDNLDKTKADITNFIKGCISQQSKEALDTLALGGGTFTPRSHARQTAGETILFFPTLFDAEQELEDALDHSLPGCINLESYRNQGYIIEMGMPKTTARIGRELLTITVKLELNISKDSATTRLDSFSESLYHPFRELHDIALDLMNSETVESNYDKEYAMLRNKGISVEIHRPYPDTLYRIEKTTPQGKVTWYMNITGVDTAGKVVLLPKAPTRQACIDTIHEQCYMNKESCDPPLKRGDTALCPENSKLDYGCCVTNEGCETMLKKSECKGKFEEKLCSELSCPNLDCQSTYNPKDGSNTGESRMNSESWCTYESRPGWGRDYVGTRHYKHSCVNGVEYIEECRDFREELCTRDTVLLNGNKINRAECKTNRWYDCTNQDDRNNCLDTQKRDCMWMPDFFTPWYNKNKCVPFVPPGFRFWEGEGEEICNIGSETPQSSAKKHPKTWSYGNFLSCIRLGDCGNYRNAADKITEGGYFHPLGKPEPWVYWDNGWIYDGGNYGITELSGKYGMEATQMPASGGSGLVTCALWEPPWSNSDCELCNSDPKRPCTEYKCKSLGRCYFDEGKCTKRPVPRQQFKISLDNAALSQGYTATSVISDYYTDATKVTVTPDIKSYENFTFGIISEKVARCRLSLRPPMVSEEDYVRILGAGFYPTLWMSDAKAALKHNITLRLPAPDTSVMLMPRWQIFVLCTDSEGNSNKDFYLDVNVIDAAGKPRILGYEPKPVPGKATEVEISVDRPYTKCSYGPPGAMQQLGCADNVMQFSMDYGFAYICRDMVTYQEGAEFDCS